MVWSCTATLYPAFDVTNQNGMSSYYFSARDSIIFTDKTVSPDGDMVRVYNWTIYPNASKGNILGNSSSRIFTFKPNVTSFPTEYYVQLGVVGNNPKIMNTTGMNFTVSDYSEYIRANFSYSVNYETTPANVTFFDLSEAQKLALINDWYWTINGEKMGDSKSPVVTKDLNPGVYKVNLTVRDKIGDIDSISKDIVVSNGGFIDFYGTPTTDYQPMSVQFYDISTFVGTDRHWDFGDGCVIDHEDSPVHVYLEQGLYNVTLTVKNGTQTKHLTKYSYITVIKAPVDPVVPVANFTHVDDVSNRTVNFTDNSLNTPVFWSWNFGDGSTSNEKKPPIHTYALFGTYYASLTVSNAAGTDSTIPKSIVLSSPSTPVAGFTYTKAGRTVIFKDASSGPILKWLLDFGDGTSSSYSSAWTSVSHPYARSGNFPVTLTVTNDGIHNNSQCQRVFVL
jgi:PKD repeat protein